MKIECLRIQKFRSIDDATINFGQVLAIVGANNVGKSHVLRALNAFFNYKEEAEAFKNHDHTYNMHARPRITVTLCDMVENDHIPQEELYGGKLTIRFTYRWDRNAPTYVKGVFSNFRYYFG